MPIMRAVQIFDRDIHSKKSLFFSPKNRVRFQQLFCTTGTADTSPNQQAGSDHRSAPDYFKCK